MCARSAGPRPGDRADSRPARSARDPARRPRQTTNAGQPTTPATAPGRPASPSSFRSRRTHPRDQVRYTARPGAPSVESAPSVPESQGNGKPMPELPEVEAVRRGIAEQLVGRVVTGYELTLPKLIEAPEGLSLDNIVGQPITGVERRGKYLAILIPDLAAMVHLKLAGQVVLRGGDTPGFAAGHPVPAFDAELPHKSTHLVLHFDNGAKLYLTDIRHFARIQLMPLDMLEAYWNELKLGPDTRSPEFTREWFVRAIRGRRLARLKPLLLDQRF